MKLFTKQTLKTYGYQSGKMEGKWKLGADVYTLLCFISR